MEGEKGNNSTIFVPAGMSDVTILSTPLPQAASTATKRRSMMEDDEGETSHTEAFIKEFDDFCQSNNAPNFGIPSTSGGWGPEQLRQWMDGGRAKQPDSAELGSDNVFRVPYDPAPRRAKSPRNSDIGVSSMPPPDRVKSADSLKSKPRRSSEMDKFKVPPAPEHSKANLGLAKYKTARDLTQSGEERSSVASSANSSLGVIPAEVLDDAYRQPLVDINADLSRRLAEQLNLDTSLLKDGLDISALANVRLKERVAAKEKDKENQRNSGRSSSDHWTIHGYSSDNSDSKNNTAKRMSALSTGSAGQESLLNKSISPSKRSRHLSEMNFTPASKSSRSIRSSLSSVSNPFGSYSNVSVNSEDFQFQPGEDAMERLDMDEKQFSIASSRSLSGIYGDADVSVNVDGMKLSMSSYMRGGSYPLGSLETGYGHSQSPQFGLPSKSPEKSGGPKAILPPPQEKSTFVVDEEPVREVPWAPSSLMEQYSNIHDSSGATDADTSVPSLSYIGEMLDRLNQGANHNDILAKLMASQNKPKNKHDNSVRPRRISSVVEGDNRFCQGVDADHSFGDRSKSVFQQSTGEASVTESVCNVTDFEGEEDPLVCVMTPHAMDFDIFNELRHPVEYSFAKACYVDGVRKDKAAFVHFPANKLMLYPGQKRTLTINIAALVAGVVKIKIEVSRRNPLTKARECSYVYGKLIAEVPKVILTSGDKDEMIPSPDCEHGRRYQHTIMLRNDGRASVPLKISVTKVSDEEVEFHFGDGERSVTVTLEPGQSYSQLVRCETPPVFAHLHPPEKIILVKAKVEFTLATTDLYQLNPVPPVTLVAPLKPHFFGAPPTLVVPTVLPLYNGYDSPIVFKAACAVGFSVQPPLFTIPPRGSFIVTVTSADVKNPLRRGELLLRAQTPAGEESRYTVQLCEDRRSSVSSNNSLTTPHSSRATSPTSPRSTPTPPGELRVACSHKQLAWGGCPLHQRVVKTFGLKNVGRQREKLRLTVSDTFFKIVGEEDSLRQELKLSLQPMENREIKVAVLATVAGPRWGHLTISRISCAADKNVLPLYAFGGKPRVSLTDGVTEVDANKYLFLDERSLKASFSLTNTGDGAAFFRISEANAKSSAGLSIAPLESVLAPGCSTSIHVSLSVTAKRLEYLLRQTAPSVHVAMLSIHSGDESTRQRLLRMRLDVLAARSNSVVCVEYLLRQTAPSVHVAMLSIHSGDESTRQRLLRMRLDVLAARSNSVVCVEYLLRQTAPSVHVAMLSIHSGDESTRQRLLRMRLDVLAARSNSVVCVEYLLRQTAPSVHVAMLSIHSGDESTRQRLLRMRLDVLAARSNSVVCVEYLLRQTAPSVHVAMLSIHSGDESTRQRLLRMRLDVLAARSNSVVCVEYLLRQTAPSVHVAMLSIHSGDESTRQRLLRMRLDVLAARSNSVVCVEYLLRQTTPSVHVAMLSIHSGDESTRQRLLRMRLDGVLAARSNSVVCVEYLLRQTAPSVHVAMLSIHSGDESTRQRLLRMRLDVLAARSNSVVCVEYLLRQTAPSVHVAMLSIHSGDESTRQRLLRMRLDGVLAARSNSVVCVEYLLRQTAPSVHVAMLSIHSGDESTRQRLLRLRLDVLAARSNSVVCVEYLLRQTAPSVHVAMLSIHSGDESTRQRLLRMRLDVLAARSNSGVCVEYLLRQTAPSVHVAMLSIHSGDESTRQRLLRMRLDVLAARSNSVVCVEYLLRQTAPSVHVAMLSIHSGDESTRQRLLRMRLDGVLAARVSQLSRIHSAHIANLEKLDGSVKGAEELWEEDTDEWTVRVFVKRTALEALSLDTAEDYVDLSKTLAQLQP